MRGAIIIPHPAQNFNTLMCDISIEDTDYFLLHGFGGVVAEMGVDGVDGATDLPLKADRQTVLMFSQPVQAFLVGQTDVNADMKL